MEVAQDFTTEIRRGDTVPPKTRAALICCTSVSLTARRGQGGPGRGAVLTDRHGCVSTSSGQSILRRHVVRSGVAPMGARGAGKAPRERRGREGRAGLGTRGWTSVQRRREGAAEPLSGPDGDAAFSGACLRCRCVAKVALRVLRKRQSSSPPWRTGDAPTPCVHDRGPALRAWGSASC